MRRGRWWISKPPLGRENSQGEERTMYRERAKGWLKHVDFMLLDVLSLELSFVLAYWIRMRSAHPYARSPYRSMGLALVLIDVVVIFFSSAYTGVLRRGYFKEASRTLYQTLLILGMSSLYLFAIQEGDSYSRIVLFLTGALYLVISYLTRIGWKALIRKIRKKPGPNALLAATTAAQAEAVIRRLQCEPRRSFHIAGLVLMDGDGEALKREYLGVPVVATRQNMVSYVCRAWVDEILFVLPDMTEYKSLADELAESGVAVREHGPRPERNRKEADRGAAGRLHGDDDDAELRDLPSGVLQACLRHRSRSGGQRDRAAGSADRGPDHLHPVAGADSV